MRKYNHIGFWWNNGSVELISLQGRIFALNGWNGRSFRYCWECFGRYSSDTLMAVGKDDYELQPIYRYEIECIDVSALDPNSEDLLRANEIMDFNIIKH